MSVVKVRTALETALAAVTPAIALVFENMKYEPLDGTPYATVDIVFAPPDNTEYGANHTIVGFLQVTLKYPLQEGSRDLENQFEVIKSAFPRGQSFASGGVTTIIQRTADIGPVLGDAERYVRPVRISFFAHINS